MKKLIVGITLLALVCALVPLSVLADTAQYITITATGSEVDITCNWTAWNVGTVHLSDNIGSGPDGGHIYTEGEMTNDGSESVDITIFGENMTDNLTTTNWVLSNTATAGAATFGMRGGTTTDNIIIKQELALPYNYIIEALAGSGTTIQFGLEFLAPTSGVGNVEMRMLKIGDAWATPTGLTLTGSPHT